MDLYALSWSALHRQVGLLSDDDLALASGCAGWLVRDLLCHLVIDTQDVLITLATPAGAPPTRDAVGYWTVTDVPPTGDDPLDALTVRLAAAHGEPWLLTHHLDLVAHLPATADPPSASLAHARAMFQSAAGTTFPAGMPDVDVLRVGTGRRAPTEGERATLGALAAELPFVLG